ncbi:hypothetical protein EUA77_03305, partial [TM7 phylum sp. oral taxon 351]
LEDPIEYGISGISQIPVNTTEGGSFADGLRSILRLDPDVVMVGLMMITIILSLPLSMRILVSQQTRSILLLWDQ